ncbi:hypothetical protein ACIA5E_20525 [Nocardia asteroides]|uniref:hypothetical protein n=1 Tax=Nocardia asteroides TaxID=1824 RepID=UPI0037A9B836
MPGEGRRGRVDALDARRRVFLGVKGIGDGRHTVRRQFAQVDVATVGALRDADDLARVVAHRQEPGARATRAAAEHIGDAGRDHRMA